MLSRLLLTAGAQLSRNVGGRSTSVAKNVSKSCARYYAAEATPKSGSSAILLVGGFAAVGAGLYYAKENGLLEQYIPAEGGSAAVSAVLKAPEPKKDYAAVRQAIADALDVEGYDDGSYGPVLVRLAWHAAGTYDKNSNTGGTNGATMRFSPECEHGANAGLAVARGVLEPIKKKFPWISYADLWTLAGCVAIEEMGGPHIPWRPGRIDKPSGEFCPPDGRLPDGDKGAAHVRDVFYRMGFSDQEIVALVGAHTLGRCHTDRSGYVNPWTNAPTTFSNLYFQELLNKRWRKKKWKGPVQYEDPTGTLMMLPADMALIWDKGFKKIVQQYAADEDKYFQDFAAAFSKLMELGVEFPADVQYL